MKCRHVAAHMEDVVNDDHQPYGKPWRSIVSASRVSDMESPIFGRNEPWDDIPPINDKMAEENHTDGGKAPDEQERQGVGHAMDQASHESFEALDLFVDCHPIILDDVVSDEMKQYLHRLN